MLTEDSITRCMSRISVVADGDTGMQTGFQSVGHTVGFETFDRVDVEALARDAARMAVTKLDARPAPSGTMPVVIRRGSGGVLFHEACGHGLEADAIAKGASVYAGKVGEQVASPGVTLVDDGTIAGEWGTLGFDDEGHPTQRNVLIEDGVLTDYMWDYLRARKEGKPFRGNGRRESYRHLPMVRMTNTFVLDGTDDEDDIVRATDYGVYVAEFGGGQVNPATGDFVFGMLEAYLIENGEITTPLREGNLIGNGPQVLRDIDMIAGDFAMGRPGTCGKDGQGVPVGDGCPTLRVKRADRRRDGRVTLQRSGGDRRRHRRPGPARRADRGLRLARRRDAGAHLRGRGREVRLRGERGRRRAGDPRRPHRLRLRRHSRQRGRRRGARRRP